MVSDRSIKRLDAWLALREINQSQIEAQFGFTGEDILRDASYGKLTGLTKLHRPAAHPGFFYFQSERLVLLYVSDARALKGIDLADLEQRFGPPAIVLRSRGGKRSRQFVFTSAGVALSVGADVNEFLEIFPPLSVEQYQSTLYQEPAKFVR